jgi:hypothetical protein
MKAFLNSELDETEWFVSRTDLFILKGKRFQYPLNGRAGGPQTWLEILERKIIFSLL